MTDDPGPPGRWVDATPPDNVRLGTGSIVTGEWAFKRFFARGADAVTIGRWCTIDGAQFAVGEGGRVRIGDYCYLSHVVLLADLELVIGNHVVIGWNTTIADSDFHPLDPGLRVADAIACSPLGGGRERPAALRGPVVVEDDVYIGPGSAILKGVTIGAEAFVEPGSVVTSNIPPRAHVAGNPARVTV